jgi:peptide/nickel transport system ATP-binding protein
VHFDGQEISSMRADGARSAAIQAVFRITRLLDRSSGRTDVAEPLVAFAIGSAAERRRQWPSCWARSAFRRTPPGAPAPSPAASASSGVAALASNPELLVLDEPVSSLDAGVQGRILELIGALRAGRGWRSC